MHNPLLIKTFTAGGPITANRLLKLADGLVVMAAAGDMALGVSEISADAGERVDVVLAGIAEMQAGCGIAAGDSVTSDSDGRIIKAETGSCIGVALDDGGENECVGVLINRFVLGGTQSGEPAAEPGGDPPVEQQNGGDPPEEQQEQQSGDSAPVTESVTDESVTGALNDGVYVYELEHNGLLADPAPVVKSSDGNTTYTAGTDYIIDLTSGVITTLADTTIGAGDTLSVSYTYETGSSSASSGSASGG